MAATAAEVGDVDLTTRLVNTAQELNPSSSDQALAAVAIARVGDSVGVQKIIDRLTRQYPLDTFVNYYIQTASASIELNPNHPDGALALLEPTSRYEYGGVWNMYSVYIRGLAHLQLGRGKEAAADFQDKMDMTLYYSHSSKKAKRAAVENYAQPP